VKIKGKDVPDRDNDSVCECPGVGKSHRESQSWPARMEDGEEHMLGLGPGPCVLCGEEPGFHYSDHNSYKRNELSVRSLSRGCCGGRAPGASPEIEKPWGLDIFVYFCLMNSPTAVQDSHMVTPAIHMCFAY
jgi:hypothetical protein